MWQKHSLSCYDSLVLLEIYSNILIKMWKCLHRARIPFFGIESRRKQFWLGNLKLVCTLSKALRREREVWRQICISLESSENKSLITRFEKDIPNSVSRPFLLPYEQAPGIAIKNEYLDARVLFHFKILPFKYPNQFFISLLNNRLSSPSKHTSSWPFTP